MNRDKARGKEQGAPSQGSTRGKYSDTGQGREKPRQVHTGERATRLLSQTWGGAEERRRSKGSLYEPCAPPRPHLMEDLSTTGINPGPRSLPPKVQVYPSVFGSTLLAVMHKGQTQT